MKHTSAWWVLVCYPCCATRDPSQISLYKRSRNQAPLQQTLLPSRPLAWKLPEGPWSKTVARRSQAPWQHGREGTKPRKPLPTSPQTSLPTSPTPQPPPPNQLPNLPPPPTHSPTSPPPTHSPTSPPQPTPQPTSPHPHLLPNLLNPPLPNPTRNLSQPPPTSVPPACQ